MLFRSAQRVSSLRSSGHRHQISFRSASQINARTVHNGSCSCKCLSQHLIPYRLITLVLHVARYSLKHILPLKFSPFFRVVTCTIHVIRTLKLLKQVLFAIPQFTFTNTLWSINGEGGHSAGKMKWGTNEVTRCNSRKISHDSQRLQMSDEVSLCWQ